MTDAKQDALDQTIAEWMGWKEIPTGEWHCNLQPLRYRCPSPTRVPADTWALLEWCWKEGDSDLSFMNENKVVVLNNLITRQWVEIENENPALALCEAVVKMIEEGE